MDERIDITVTLEGRNGKEGTDKFKARFTAEFENCSVSLFRLLQGELADAMQKFDTAAGGAGEAVTQRAA